MRFLIEQPINSLFYENVNIATLIGMTGALRFTSCMGGFGGPTLKRLEFYSTMLQHENQALVKTPRDFSNSCGQNKLATLMR